MELSGKTVLVTGAAHGIGRETVTGLLAKGARVVGWDVDEPGLDARARAVTGELRSRRCDVRRREDVQAAVDELIADGGEIHALVNNAGIIRNLPLVQLGRDGVQAHPEDVWDDVIDTNLGGVFRVGAEVARAMVHKRTRGVIVNVSSVAAAGNIGQSAYAAAKAGVQALTRTWARELSGFRIRVVAIAPGFTETDTTLASISETVQKEWVKQTPVRRMGTPAEIVGGILFLLENDFASGKVLELDGGLVL
jgi:3-oxoacyl-[acyl-carrier protein] reductase